LTGRISFERGAEDLEETPAIWPSLVSYASPIPLAAVHIVVFATGNTNVPPPLLEGGTLAVFALAIDRASVQHLDADVGNGHLTASYRRAGCRHARKTIIVASEVSRPSVEARTFCRRGCLAGEPQQRHPEA